MTAATCPSERPGRTLGSVATRQALLAAAGELFAEHGLRGVGTREIAAKAGVNVAAIQYHFGSKENLHREALRHVLNLHGDVIRDALASRRGRAATTAGQARTLAGIVHRQFATFFLSGRPGWHSRLLIRSLVEPEEAVRVILEEKFRREYDALRGFLARLRPGMSEEARRLWCFSLLGEITFYVFARDLVLGLLGRETYDRAFIEEAAAHVSALLAHALDLPDGEPHS
jgi:AcrR family transcriptional regulator